MWRMVYAQETNAAIRNSKRLGGDYQNAAKVAQELLRNVAGAEKKYDRVAGSHARATGHEICDGPLFAEAGTLFKGADNSCDNSGNDAAASGDADAWWVERRIIARHSVGIQHKDSVKAAYQISKAHGSTKGPNAVEGEFLAGWIALRSLKDPETALRHFTKLEDIARVTHREGAGPILDRPVLWGPGQQGEVARDL